MVRILGVFLVLAVYSISFAGGFYKWKDESGKVHITDYLPDGVEVISGGAGMSVNRVSSPNIQDSSSQGGEYDSSEYQSHAETLGHELDADITESKNNYDTCMRNVKGDFGNDLSKNFEIVMKRNECKRYFDVYQDLLRSKYNSRKVFSRSNSKSSDSFPTQVVSPHQGIVSPQQNIIPHSPHMNVNSHGGATDQYGTFYAPSGAGNMINTRTGSQVIPQGGGTYLDTQTGRIMHGN
jgi:hypothetical protein